MAGNIDILCERIKVLEEENERLKRLLTQHNIALVNGELNVSKKASSPHEMLNNTQSLSLKDKVELFQSLFKGREDVFAKRWYSETTKKAGYQPVCEREWNRGFCDKKKYKCAECPNRQFAHLSYEYIYNHLAGKDALGRDVIGVYPILMDNTCYFICADFDDKSCEHGYKNDVLAFVSVCKEWGVDCYIERSRSGNGAHVWIFFDLPIATRKARRLGNLILTEAMNRESRISFKSYDRFFPNQDTLPDGGLGNLVALPLQGKARREGNSVFVDENFNAYTDQWSALMNVSRLTEASVDNIIGKYNVNSLGEFSKSSENKPWEPPVIEVLTKSDFPGKITLIRANMLYIPLIDLSAKAINRLKRIAAFRNPEFYAKRVMRLSTYDVPRIISCSELKDGYLAMPRGCEEDVAELLQYNQVKCHYQDETNHGKTINIEFKGVLRQEQYEAMKSMIPYNIGTLSATTAFGKTIFAIAMIAQCKVNTLILVHRKSLVDQWKRQLEDFTEINEQVVNDNAKRKSKKHLSPIGVLYSGKNSLHGIVDIALIQSCFEDKEVKSFVQNYGMVIVDECHHVSSVSFEQVLKQVRAKYVYGLTATPIRKDGHQPIIFMQCGKIRFTADAQSQIKNQNFRRTLIPRFTSFRNLSPDVKTYAQIIETLSIDNVRNNLIVEDVKNQVLEGRTPIILTSLTSHVRLLADMLRPFADNIIALVGADSDKNKRLELERLLAIRSSESLIIVATGKYIGEGFDFSRLDTLFLALPISWKGNIAQYAGRLHREYDGKTEVRIYDYIDARVPLCESMYRKRMKGYVSVGYGVTNSLVLNETKRSLIYNGTLFQTAFLQDLQTAKHSIIISIQMVKYRYTPRLVAVLKDLQRNGIEVIVHLKEKGYNDNDLICDGIDIVHNNNLTIQCAIIDKSIVWYGNINFFGYNADEDNIMRLQNVSIADELLDILYEKA